jgi:methylenetetrahydrofolate reductase (NADPH)
MEKNYWADIHYLKAKIDAGADFVITQLFYDADRYLKYIKDCRSVGITAPILPGIMPIMTYGGFNRMTAFCKTMVPKHILDTVEAIKDNDEAVKAYGISLGTMMCQRLLQAGVPGLHMYTLNLEKTAVEILKNVGLIEGEEASTTGFISGGGMEAVADGTTTTVEVDGGVPDASGGNVAVMAA